MSQGPRRSASGWGAVTGAFGLLLGAAGLIGSAVWLWNTLPPTSGLMGSVRNGNGATVPAGLESIMRPAAVAGTMVAVVADRRNERVTPEGFYAAEVHRWRDWLASSGATLTTPADAELLVLPHSICLTPSTHALVQRHLARGGGLITTGALGARDAECRETGDTLLVTLLGAEDGGVAALWDDGEGAHFAVVPGEAALGAGIPPGARIALRRADQLIFRGRDRELYYADHSRNPVARGGVAYYDGAVVRALVGAGRVVAFGFALSQVEEGWSEAVARALVANAAVWASGRPLAQLAPWPGGARSAVVLAQDVVRDHGNAVRAAEALARERVRGTYFVGADGLERNRADVRRLADMGEVAARPIGTWVFAGEPGENQARWLGATQREFEAALGRPVAGVRVPGEQFDEATLRAWRVVGGGYLVAVNDGRSAAPELIPLDGGELVLLPRVAADDYHVIVKEALVDRSRIARRFLGEIEQTVAVRGLHVLAYRSDILAGPELLGVLSTFARATSEDQRLWVATAGEVAEWWIERDRVRIEVSDDGTEAVLTKAGTRAFRGGTLIVDLPDGARRRVEVPEIRAGGTVTVRIE